MESQSQNPEFKNNPDNFHPCLNSRQKFMLLRLFNKCSVIKNNNLKTHDRKATDKEITWIARA